MANIMNSITSTISDSTDSKAAPTYRSGSAARLSGVPVETLRVWERRYSVVNPKRSEHGQREYSLDQIKQLSLIKQLVDLGNQIGVVARLSREELLEMLSITKASAADSSSANGVSKAEANHIRVAVVAERMGTSLVGMCNCSAVLEVIGNGTTMKNALAGWAEVTAEVLLGEINEMADVDLDSIDQIRRKIKAYGGVILYRFARHSVIRKLRSAGFVVARIPSDPKEIEALCQRALVMHVLTQAPTKSHEATQPEVAAARFNDKALSAIELASNSVYCECPRHLVDIVRTLSSFERYSAECQNRNLDDVALHRAMGKATAQARVIMEKMLEQVAKAEGLPLPD